MYKKLLEGHISFGGIQDALEAVCRLRDVKNGVLQIISQDCSGMIGIFCGRFITGAVLTISGETGNRALRRLLASKEGKFTFLDAGDDVLPDLKQSLGVDIDLLLASGLSPDVLPTDDALRGLGVSADNIKTINTDDIIVPEKEEDRMHRIRRTYDKLMSLSQQQALASRSLEEQITQVVQPPAKGLEEAISHSKSTADSKHDLDPEAPPPASEPPPRPAELPLPTPDKPMIPPWDEPWEPPAPPVETAPPAEFKRIKKWNQNSSAYQSLSLIVFFVIIALGFFYLLPHITAFLSHLQ